MPQLRPPPAPAAEARRRAPSVPATAAPAPAASATAPFSDAQLLLQAVLRGADQLELSRSALALVLGRDCSLFSRGKGIEPASKTGQVPAEQVQRTESLVEIVHYLDAMRARV